jgi:23S rRNA G2069 N7-methylase RlmK/C1962 C5-methylase RlmI
VGPDAIGELLRVTKTGGYIVISVNEHHWRALQFEHILSTMADQYDTYETRIVAIYGVSADHEHKDDLARALIIKK